ncbi:amphi-Trp domain-containing protein [Brevibacterium senegalense]|uniref:amphi-Trp domain-containing protein n=1 Tax=Brevibacterium senegalense TaxID=1033736 RepID=UPI0002F80DA9|nr:amphi-Trp domain-containing protein [Brevibacterium senegalense]
MSDELFEHETETTITREQAAAKLRALADALEKQNSIRVVQSGHDVTVRVGDTVDYELEVEVEPGGKSEIEVTLSW